MVLIDTDVLIHFDKAERLSLLQELFPGRIYMLDLIIGELRSMSGSRIDMMLKLGIVREMPFPTNDSSIFEEYTALKRTKGNGESACMAICRFQKKVLASSNLRDIAPYCTMHSIRYLTTMDILAIGYKKGKITMAEGDGCISLIRTKNSKLPAMTLKQFIETSFDTKKLNY